MAKQFGLILPGQMKKSAPKNREVTKPSVFDESSDSNDDEKFYEPLKKQKENPMSMLERRKARQLQEKALEEDPTVFQYDELYDEMESKREDEKQKKSNEPKKPKYIGRLMEVAERRKLENELRIERQVQKDREQEGEEFKDKEAFVTEAYRKKLEERRKLEEQDKRDEYLEAIGDVTKQKDLDGFYRHLYEQKLGTEKEVKKPELPTTVKEEEEEDAEISYKPIKSGKPQQRTYRKRRSSDDDEEEAPVETKKVHLQNNIDADSDFSIDSSSDEDDDTNDKKKNVKKDDSKSSQTDGSKIALNLDVLKKDANQAIKEQEHTVKEEKNLLPPPTIIDAPKSPKPKIDKSKIWEKRTVGEVFEAAVKRYYERKATRSA